MSVTKQVYQVNEGAVDWTKSDVIDAMEAAFAGLGWHSGTAKTGVPTSCLPPGTDFPIRYASSSNYRYATKAAYTEYFRYLRRYNISNDGGSSHWKVTYYDDFTYIYGSSSVGNEGWINLTDCNDIPTGTAMIYREGTATLPNRIGTSNPMFVDGDTYYVINVGDNNHVRMADSLEDANNGDFIIPVSGNSSGDFGQFEIELGNNPTIVVRQGDKITFNNDSTGHPLYIQDSPGAYDSTRTLDTNNFRPISYRDFPTNQGIEIGTLEWEIDDWAQGDYYYVCQNHPAMGGKITVLPSTNVYLESVSAGNAPYWYYTVPSGGVSGKTDLQLRIKRVSLTSTLTGHIESITVMNEATGWSEDEEFTIPGSAIGGISPDNDVVFGVNSLTTQQQTDQNGISSLKVTDIGGGSTFYQKFNDGAILRLEHDSDKEYGHVYYGFRMERDDDYRIWIGAGVEWEYLNFIPSSSRWDYQGRWGGQIGMDIPGYGIYLSNDSSYYHYHNYVRDITPTQYPLKIVTHKATSPQDTNFATISFVQTINGVDYSYLTFSPTKGTAVGSNIWDLDYVWNGSYITISNQDWGGDENISISCHFPWNRSSGDEESGDTYAVRREAFHGFKRDPQISNNSYVWQDNYSNNIYEVQSGNVNQNIGYYRNSNFDFVTINSDSYTYGNKNDAVGSISVDPNADYYRPFKGLPMNSRMMPCPYYLPDDFTVIQFAVNPGSTAFRFGDTITIDDSEVYEIIQVNYSTNQLGLDGISGNTSTGIAFCARTT